MQYFSNMQTKNPYQNLIWRGFNKVNSDMKSIVFKNYLTQNISIVNTNLLQNQ